MTPVLVTAVIAVLAAVATYGLLALVRFPRPGRTAGSKEPADAAAEAAAPLVAGVVALSALAVAGLTLGLLARGIERKTALVGWDEDVERWAAGHAGTVGTQTLRAITHLGDTIVVLGLSGVAVVALLIVGKRRLALFMATVVLGQWALANGIKQLVGRARPELDPLAPFSGFSFPSGHAAAAAATYLALALVVAAVKPNWNTRIVIATGVGIAAAVATSRAMLGVHWFSDVLGGVVLGWAWCLVCAWLFRVVRPTATQDAGMTISGSG